MSATETNLKVSSHGYSDADIFFLVGYPSKADLTFGLALSGYNEVILNQYLYPLKLNLKNCYRSCFIKEKLEYSGTNTKKLREALAKVDYEGYLNILKEEIKEVNPNVIVPLDDISLAAVFPHINTLHKPKGRKYWSYCYRGSILPLRTDFGFEKQIKVIPTLSPFLLEVDWTARNSFVTLDFKKIKEYSLSTQPIEEYGLCWVARTAIEFETFLRRSYEKNPKRLSFDIETYGGLLTCISFCFDSYESCTVPLNDSTVSPAERALLWKLVGRILASPIEKNNQNIKYDWTILERMGFKVNNVFSDTMLKGSLLYPELPKGLDFYTSVYTPIAYYKDEGKEFNPKLHSRDRLYIYCAKDSLSASIISNKQDEELIENGCKSLYDNEVAPSILIYKNMDETGILVDAVQKKKLLDKYENLYNSNVSILRNLIGDPLFNPASPKQVGKIIYEELKFPVRYKTLENGVKSYKTDKETLDDLLINHADKNKAGFTGVKILERQIVCRKLTKALEYIETPLHFDSTFRGSSNLAGTTTGRSSFSKTIDEILLSEQRNNKWTRRLGRSLQTITKHGFQIDEDIFEDFESSEIANDLRSMFVPHKDFVFIECDGKGAEARVVFVLAEDFEALAAMDAKPSLHAKTIALILDLDATKITKTSPMIPKINVPAYELGKRIRHAGHNGMRAFRLSQYIHAKLGYCEMLMNKFHAVNPKIKLNFHDPLREIIRQQRFLTCPNLRRRDFFGKLGDELYQEALCYIQQATVSDLTKFTIHRIVSSLDGYMKRYKFLNEAHDSFLSEVHKDYIVPYIYTTKHFYERPINFANCSLSRDFELRIPVEVATSSDNWMSLTEFKL
jgi:DNA polymerase I-like protein with 3'-5' exonuclease and polymerase domains